MATLVRGRTVGAGLFLLGLLAPPAPARATWSVVAVDPRTGEVGVAGASCIAGAELIAELAPAHGAVAAQAVPNLSARSEIARRLALGESPAAALAAVTDPATDTLLGVDLTRVRQYGAAAVGFENASASYTGAWTVGWAGAQTGPGVSVQGNMLAGPEVVEQAMRAFEAERPGCRPRLSDRLVAALVAGSRAGGDRRCNPALSALSAFVVVAQPRDDSARPSLRLTMTRPGASLENPWSVLRRSVLLGQARGTAEGNPVLLLEQAYAEKFGTMAGCP